MVRGDINAHIQGTLLSLYCCQGKTDAVNSSIAAAILDGPALVSSLMGIIDRAVSAQGPLTLGGVAGGSEMLVALASPLGPEQDVALTVLRQEGNTHHVPDLMVYQDW
jgi:hypothetical protein